MKAHPDRYFECFIAEQNMVGVAVGLSTRGKIPFVSTFAAFLTRAFDHIRMSAISDANIKYVGSHCGVSIGQDGPSQMGLEDIAMMRAIPNSVVVYPSDAVAAERLVAEVAQHKGIAYIRTSRPKTPVLYPNDEEFKIGGCKVLRSNDNDEVTVVSAGVTIHEVLKAYEILKKEGIHIRVIDAYSVKPIDEETLKKSASETNNTIICVEDHYYDGGLGDAVLNAVAKHGVRVHKMAVKELPRSGKPEELMELYGISAGCIVKKVLEVKG
jgi:transketolase